MRRQEKRVGLVNFDAWRFEVFEGRDGGWKLVLHPPVGCSLKPETIKTDQANGLEELLEHAKQYAFRLERHYVSKLALTS
jgi:hypothetical protein